MIKNKQISLSPSDVQDKVEKQFAVVSIKNNWKWYRPKMMKNIKNFILGIFLTNLLTNQRFWDMLDWSEPILSGSNEQILL